MASSSASFGLRLPAGSDTVNVTTDLSDNYQIIEDLLDGTTNDAQMTPRLQSGTRIEDTTRDHGYVVAVSELAADRTVTLPLLTSNDTFIFAAFAATLTNKTLTSPVINVSSDAQGDVYYRSSAGAFTRLAPGTSGHFLKTGGASANPAWAAASSAMDVGSDAQGDVYYRSSGGAFTRLAPGTAGQFLKTGGSSANPAWAAASSAMDVGSDAQGDVYYRNSSGAFARLAPGTSGYFLKTQGSSADPAWAVAGGIGTVWVQPHWSGGTHLLAATNGDYGVTSLGNASADGNCRAAWHVPTDFTTLSKAVLVAHPVESGNVVWTCNTDFAAHGEAHQANSDTIGNTTTSATGQQVLALDISDAFTGLAAGDYCGMNFTRKGSDGSDSITSFLVLGILFEYR